MSAGGNISMSKQFRLNFYSANLVSDKVCAVRKRMMTNSAFWSLQLVAVSLYTKDTQIVHGGVNPRNENDWALEGGPIRVLGGTPTVGLGGEALSIHSLLH